MNKLLALLLCLILGLPLPLLAQTFPPLQVTGPEIPGNNYDDDGDGVTDEIPATSISEDPDALGNYHFHFKDCEKVGFANVADTTFPDSIRVEKPAGATIIEGEMVCYIPNLPAGTYALHLLYSTPSGTRAVWPGVNKSLRYQMKPEEASILPANNTPQWLPLIYAGTAANYYAGSNGGDQVQFVWKGGSFALAFKGDEARYACGYLATGPTSTRTCPGQSGTPAFQGYTMYELGKEAVPTAYNSAAFTNALPMAFSGSEVGTVCGGTVTVKGLWDDTTTDRQYWSIVCNDTDAVTVTATNDATTMPAANEDGVDIRWRGDLSALFDTNTYMVKGNLQPVYFDADWSGTANARNPAVNLNTTVVRNINAGVSWNMFIAADIGFSVTPDTIGLFNLAIIDFDTGVAGAFKYFHGNSVTDAGQYGAIKWALATVPPSGGGTDVTAPVVTSPAIPSATVTQSSFIMTANTGEQGLCSMRVGAVKSGQYELTPVTGTQSVNGVCSVAKTGLTAGVTFYAVIDVTDAAGNVGTSSEVSTKTLAPDPPNNCTKFAAPLAAGKQDGSSVSDPYLINGFWTSGHAVPGAVLCLASGNYTGVSSMIRPTAGLNGSALNPIVIKATTDGGPWIQGQSTNIPVILNNNDYWILEGFDASDAPATGAVVLLQNGTSNSIVRRVCAWDGGATNQRVIGITSSTSLNNLIEDACAFGSSRRAVAVTQGGHGITLRRVWAAFTGPAGGGGPESAFQFAYQSETNTLENVIGTWKQATAGDSVAGSETSIVHLANEGTNHKVLGSLFYIRSGDMFVPSRLFRSDFGATPAHGPIEMRDVILVTEQTSKQPWSLGAQGGCTSCTLTNTTEIGGVASSINAAWTITNRADLADLSALNAGNNPFQTATGTGARMCFRYENRTLTSTKLWPWPMDSRISAALVRSGRLAADYFRGTGNTVTSEVETQFGMIPSGCKG